MEFDNGRAKTAHKHRLLLLLDEFPTLGRIDVFEKRWHTSLVTVIKPT